VSRRIASASPAVVLQAEKDIKSRLKGQHFDFTAMSAVSNVYRAGTAVRNHMERTVLAEYDLSWVAFTVLWVLWIWDTQETGHVAEEAGVTKGTLTGVIKTIELTTSGEHLIEALFPKFNQHERVAVSALTAAEQRELARLLRKVTHRVAESEED
jgi:MarR family transcriptional regulator, organic hydroperoxide resistance regulator